jgi:hypothetical protein
MEDEYGTTPMFEVPKKYRAPKRAPEFPQWRKYVGKRTTCDDCILAIMQDKRRFLAGNAAFVRTDENGRTFYCGEHAVHRKAMDPKGK